MLGTREFTRNTVPHIVISSSRIHPNRHSIGSPNLNQDLEDPQRESCTILDTASPFVCALIRCAIYELADEISVGSMYYQLSDEYVAKTIRMKAYFQRHRILLP